MTALEHLKRVADELLELTDAHLSDPTLRDCVRGLASRALEHWRAEWESERAAKKIGNQP